MIQNPKKQFTRSRLCLTFSLSLPLAGFFVYALVFDHGFFTFIAVGVVLCILILLSIRNSFYTKKADDELTALNLQEQINLLEAETNAKRHIIHSLNEKIVNFSLLKGMTEKLTMCQTLDDTAKALSEEVNKLFGAKDSTIILYLFQSKTGELGISSSHKGQMRVNLKSKKGDIFDQWIVKTMQPLLIEDAKSDFRFNIDEVKSEEVRTILSVISVPLMVGNKALGILRVDSPHEKFFTTEDLRILQTMGDVGSLVIENAQLHERVEELAVKDGLTNLYLRRHLIGRMKDEIARQNRRKGEVSFLMIDIDKFKQYNDKFGHSAGDILLKTLAGRLKEFFNQAGSLACRYGGEEFCVMLPQVSSKQAFKLAEDFRKLIGKTTILLRREKTSVSVSIGVAAFPKNAGTMEELVQCADKALYKAKENGRNRVCAA